MVAPLSLASLGTEDEPDVFFEPLNQSDLDDLVLKPGAASRVLGRKHHIEGDASDEEEFEDGPVLDRKMLGALFGGARSRENGVEGFPAETQEIQDAHQLEGVPHPSSGKRVLAWNDYGKVTKNFDGERHRLEVEFATAQTGTKQVILDYDRFNMAAITEDGAVFGVAALDGAPSKILVRPAERWNKGFFRAHLPQGEDVQAVAIGDSFVAALCTETLRLLGHSAVHLAILAAPGRPVAMAARGYLLLVVTERTPVVAKESKLEFVLMDMRSYSRRAEGYVPLSPSSSLVWAGVSTEMLPTILDSSGLVQALPLPEGLWTPVLDLGLEASGKNPPRVISSQGWALQVMERKAGEGQELKKETYPFRLPLGPFPSGLNLPTGTTAGCAEEQILREQIFTRHLEDVHQIALISGEEFVAALDTKARDEYHFRHFGTLAQAGKHAWALEVAKSFLRYPGSRSCVLLMKAKAFAEHAGYDRLVKDLAKLQSGAAGGLPKGETLARQALRPGQRQASVTKPLRESSTAPASGGEWSSPQLDNAEACALEVQVLPTPQTKIEMPLEAQTRHEVAPAMDNGAREQEVDASQKPEFQHGDTVIMRDEVSGHWKRGAISICSANGVFEVRLDAGGIHSDVPASRLKRVGKPRACQSAAPSSLEVDTSPPSVASPSPMSSICANVTTHVASSAEQDTSPGIAQSTSGALQSSLADATVDMSSAPNQNLNLENPADVNQDTPADGDGDSNHEVLAGPPEGDDDFNHEVPEPMDQDFNPFGSDSFLCSAGPEPHLVSSDRQLEEHEMVFAEAEVPQARVQQATSNPFARPRGAPQRSGSSHMLAAALAGAKRMGERDAAQDELYESPAKVPRVETASTSTKEKSVGSSKSKSGTKNNGSKQASKDRKEADSKVGGTPQVGSGMLGKWKTSATPLLKVGTALVTPNDGPGIVEKLGEEDGDSSVVVRLESGNVLNLEKQAAELMVCPNHESTKRTSKNQAKSPKDERKLSAKTQSQRKNAEKPGVGSKQLNSFFKSASGPIEIPSVMKTSRPVEDTTASADDITSAVPAIQACTESQSSEVNVTNTAAGSDMLRSLLNAHSEAPRDEEMDAETSKAKEASVVTPKSMDVDVAGSAAQNPEVASSNSISLQEASAKADPFGAFGQFLPAADEFLEDPLDA